MKHLITAIFILFCTSVYSAETRVIRVIDGDTIEVSANWLPKELGSSLRLRVYGVDTPEKAPRAKCDTEAAKGAAATQFTKDTIEQGKQIKVAFKQWDKFGGRILGDIIIDGNSLREMLIVKGMAREYFGEKKQSWCN